MRAVTDTEYQNLVDHARRVGPLRVHWRAMSGEWRRLTVAAYGVDSLAIETWLPTYMDTVNWTDLVPVRVRMTDVGCDRSLDRAAEWKPEHPGVATPIEPVSSAEQVWEMSIQMAHDFSYLDGESPLAISGLGRGHPPEPDMTPSEQQATEVAMAAAFEGRLSDEHLRDLEGAARSYIDRGGPSLPYWNLDYLRFVLETTCSLNIEMGRCLLRSLEEGTACASPELQRQQRLQLEWGMRSVEQCDSDLYLLDLVARRESYEDEHGNIVQPLRKAEILASIEELEAASQDLDRVIAVYSKFLESPSARPLAAP